MGNCLCVKEPASGVHEPSSTIHPYPVSSFHDIYREATYETTPEFTFNGQRHTVKILRILDGDTVDIALYHPESHRMYRHRVRLYGIDTPEKRPSKSDPLRHLEIEASHRATQALESCIPADRIVEALFYKADKYGRLLCTLYDAQRRDLNQWMIANGYATAYYGKTKKKFEAFSASPASSAPASYDAEDPDAPNRI